jgi:hypothetical protein
MSVACQHPAKQAGGGSTQPPGGASFCSPVIALVEGGCIGVHGGTTLYEISSANPKPTVGQLISGSGTPSGAPTFCQQGTHLINVTWHVVATCRLRNNPN